MRKSDSIIPQFDYFKHYNSYFLVLFPKYKNLIYLTKELLFK